MTRVRTTFNKQEHTTKWIPVKDISVVWANAQRPPDERFSQKIAREMDPDLFGVLTVTLPNGSGIYHCVDGQRRRRAAEIFAGENECVPCNVLNAKTPAEAAHIFHQMTTNQTAIQAIDKFKVGVTAEYETEVAINKLLGELGYTVTHNRCEGGLRAIRAVVDVYKRFGPETLQDAFLIIQGIWGKDPDSVDGSMVKGFALLVAEHGAHVDRQRLVNVVAKQFTPARFLGAAKSAREVYSCNVAESVKRILVKTYDYRLRNGKLDKSS